MNFPLGVFQIINLLNALSSLSIGLFVLFMKRTSRLTILFSTFALLVSLWSFFYVLAFQTTDLILSRFLFRTCMLAGVLILPTFTEFVLALTGKKIPTFYRWINWGIACLIISTIYTNLYAHDGGPFLMFIYWPTISITSFIQVIHYIVNALFSLGVLLHNSLSKTSHIKQQAKTIVLGISIGYLGAATNFLLWFRIPFPPILNIFIPIYVISVAFAILKHRLMDINIIIKKGLAYSTIIAIFTGLYLSAIYILTRLSENILGFGSLGIAAALIFIFAILFQPLKNKINQTIDRLFFKSSYEYHVALKNISKKIATANNLRELNTLVSKEIKGVLKVSDARIQMYN